MKDLTGLMRCSAIRKTDYWPTIAMMPMMARPRTGCSRWKVTMDLTGYSEKHYLAMKHWKGWKVKRRNSVILTKGYLPMILTKPMRVKLMTDCSEMIGLKAKPRTAMTEKINCLEIHSKGLKHCSVTRLTVNLESSENFDYWAILTKENLHYFVMIENLDC